VLEVFFPVSVMVTLALAIGAPALSVMLPRILPVVTCAETISALQKSASIITTPENVIVFLLMVSSLNLCKN
jgi:hypothetical protein